MTQRRDGGHTQVRKLANSSEMLDQDQDEDEGPEKCSSHPTIGIMIGAGVAAAHFWATLSIHIDSHGRDSGRGGHWCHSDHTLHK